MADGDLEFLGRFDDQVKLRGFRVELGEIEAALRRAPGVLAAAADVRRGEGPDLLVGYVVPQEGAGLDEDALRAVLRGHPAPLHGPGDAWWPWRPCPPSPAASWTASACRRPRPGRPSPARPRTGPPPPGRRPWPQAWGRLFHREQVGLGEDFFLDLGGHSLLAALMVSELRRRARPSRGSRCPTCTPSPPWRSWPGSWTPRTFTPGSRGAPPRPRGPLDPVGLQRRAVRAGSTPCWATSACSGWRPTSSTPGW